jgi:uncharacterized protein YdeI (YjbR/CyaY-like superfamily)
MSGKTRTDIKPTFFPTPTAFRKWLEKNHQKKTELLVGFYKVGSGKPSMTWPESVDQALCFGWIDGVRKSIDDNSYTIRFTPRKPGSNWSAINIKKIAALKKAGLMSDAGLKVFEKRSDARSAVYSYENLPVTLDKEYEMKFRKEKEAWKFFDAQAPGYKKVLVHWIMRAKREETRLSRLEKAIKVSGERKRMLW